MSTERLRVGHVVTNLHDGGIEQMIFDQLRQLPSERFEARIYALTSSNPWRHRFEEIGVRIRTYDFENRPAVRDLPAFVLNLAALASDLRDDDLDILQVHDFFPGVVGRIAGILAGTPRLIATLHNTYTWLGRVHGLINRLLGRWTEAIVGVSEACVQDSLARDKVPVYKYLRIHNGVDPQRFRPRGDAAARLRSELGWPTECIILCNVGTFSERKRQSDLLEAFNMAAGSANDLRLLIIGSRREHEAGVHEDLMQRIASSPYHNRIAVLSGRHDVEMLLSGSDLYCMPSRVEGFGIALVEAMLCGLPVLCSDIPAFREIVTEDASGFFFPVGNTLAISQIIVLLAHSTHLRNTVGMAARTEAVNRFADKAMRSQYCALFQGIGGQVTR